MTEQHKSRQELFLAEHRRMKYTVAAIRVISLVCLLILWEVASRAEWIDSFIFCSPSSIARCFARMASDQSLFYHIWITLYETMVCFALSVLLGELFAILLWLSRRFARVMEPYLVVLNSLPKSALAPLLIVWLGANVKTIIVSGISVAIFGTILNLYTGFQEVDNEQIKLIRTLGGGKLQILKKVILPSTMPLLISIMKVNIGLSLVGVIIGEFLAANEGLGYLIIYGSETFKMDWMLMSIVLLCLIAMVLYKAIAALEKWYAKR